MPPTTATRAAMVRTCNDALPVEVRGAGSVCAVMASEPEHPVPFLVERVAGGDEVVHVRRREQLVIREPSSARHRGSILTHGAVVEILVGLLVVLPAQGHLPVDEKTGGLGVRRAIGDAAQQRA